ncbi:hypothetical protein [Streptomyces winkii]|uniref:hypothetical protein n=1 Tax=Streptomyces winkii TaxID=3051178 RepID=UPI0028D24B42|nr:hypothetical protein [Streptomyces sp. DSM 40971]
MPLMPPPDPPAWGRTQPPAGPRRRSMVAGTLGTLGPLGVLTTLTAGCSGDAASADSEQNAAADKRLRREATGQSLDLLAHYDATVDAHSGLRDRLRPLRAATLRHAEVLSGQDDKNGEKDKGGGGGGGSSLEKDNKHRRPRVPADEKAALAALGDAERRTAHTRTTALVKAPPETARLLASLAAAGAAHAYLLGAEGAGDGKDGGA